ncbi:MAG: hypothetical protein PQJ59_05895 [Spirochaetales bacterium]|nr:hypothetical protein [Spirochaetales bacterium]
MKSKEGLFHRLNTILHEDSRLNSETWFDVQPCKIYRIFGKSLVITQPSSSFWVYLLGILTTLQGVKFLASAGAEMSRTLWGWSLILWGVGALIAGTSYQAFGYQIKCAGRERVVWTSWWEIIYLILQQLSINVMFVGVVYSRLSRYFSVAVFLALLVSVFYITMVLNGAFKPIKKLITYELMVKFCTPFVFVCILLNLVLLIKSYNSLDGALLGVWFGLIFIDRLYWWYYKKGYSEKLWSRKRWFTENDVLHVTLILWVAYIAFVVEPLIKDGV